MIKIKTVFIIDRETNLATNKFLDGNEWVLNGEGRATVKFDGTSCMIKEGVLFKRWNRKPTKKALRKIKEAKRNGTKLEINEGFFKAIPDGAIACNESFDPITLHWPHWTPVGNGNDDLLHREGFESLEFVTDGTFELCGPKVRCNPHHLDSHKLFKHGDKVIEVKDRSFKAIKELLKDFDGEGLVFHHSDGRMVKVRRKDMFIFKNVPEGRREEWFLDEIETDPEAYKNLPDHYEIMKDLLGK